MLHCSHWGFDIPASSGTISPSGLMAGTPRGITTMICKILGWWSSFQLAGRGSGLRRGQPGRGWGHQHKAQGRGWMTRTVGRVAEPCPAGSGKRPGPEPCGPEPCGPPRRVAAGGAGAARGCGALPAAGAAIVCLQSRCFRQNQKHQLGKSSSQKILRLQNRSSKTPKRESV